LLCRAGVNINYLGFFAGSGNIRQTSSGAVEGTPARAQQQKSASLLFNYNCRIFEFLTEGPVAVIFLMVLINHFGPAPFISFCCQQFGDGDNKVGSLIIAAAVLFAHNFV